MLRVIYGAWILTTGALSCSTAATDTVHRNQAHKAGSLISPNSKDMVRIATSALGRPYAFASDQGCTENAGGVPLQRPDGSDWICGFEIELFESICSAVGLNCKWQFIPWDGGHEDSTGHLTFAPNSIFDQLVAPPEDGSAYDVAVNLTEATLARRRLMLFTGRYFTSWHMFIGAPRMRGRVEFNARGFPRDRPIDGHQLRIATYSGFLVAELKRALSASPSHIDARGYGDPLAELVAGNTDLLFAYAGIDHEASSRGFVVLSDKIKQLDVDPRGGVAAATQITPRGRRLQEQLSEGLVKVKCGGRYDELSLKWLKRDAWDYDTGPLVNESVCTHQGIALPPSP